MWGNKSNGEKKEEGNGLVAVAVDKDKSSQHALKWAADHIVTKGQTILLVHVNHRQPPSVTTTLGSHSFISNVSHNLPSPNRRQIDSITRELFLPFRCFCTRKEIHCMDVLLEDTDIAKAIIEFVSHSAIESLVVGTSSRSPFVRRFKNTDVPTSITKGAPDFCTVYVISKGKVSSVRSASRPAPIINNTLHNHVTPPQPNLASTNIPQAPKEETTLGHRPSNSDAESIKSPFSRGGRGQHTKSYGDIKLPDTDLSFVSSSTARPSMESIEFIESGGRTLSHLAGDQDYNFDHRPSLDLMRSMHNRALNLQYIGPDLSSDPHENGATPWISGSMDDVEAEMRRLKLELKQTMDMYSNACKEALVAKQKARELHRWKIEEEQRLEAVRLAEEAALAIAEKEKIKCKAAIEAAEAAQKIAELEGQKRINAEMKATKEAEEKKKALDALAHTDVRYRKYTIEEIENATEYFHEGRKIGEGGYGPVYRCYLDHTEVAIKVLRPDAAQGRSQFQQEIEVLSCIRHPNMVLLLGACPEYGCLVYEYLANGSLEDRLFQRGNTPVLPWQLRFRIAAEIGTGLLFLHQTKPEPLVHRDLKPGNILLDRNYVSKISDVGLARLVPPSVANNVTQYRMTSTAGTFCYIDPEYQQTGMLGVKSDIYSLGIMLLQIITGRSPMGLAHHVDHAIEKGNFSDMLDPAVKDWPVQEALSFAKLALQCAELRRKDRPDLGTVVLPELQRLRALADKNMHHIIFNATASPNNQTHVSILQDIISDPQFLQSGSESSKSRSSA